MLIVKIKDRGCHVVICSAELLNGSPGALEWFLWWWWWLVTEQSTLCKHCNDKYKAGVSNNSTARCSNRAAVFRLKVQRDIIRSSIRSIIFL